MTTLLTFGDSNTYGTVPIFDETTRVRYAPETRWPRRVAAALGWELVEAGLPGRTVATPDPNDMGVHMDGRLGLQIALESCGPIDLMTLMLGTNDVKQAFNLTAEEIAAQLEDLIETALSNEMQSRHNGFKLLLIAPPPIREVGYLADKYAGAEQASNALPALLEALAKKHKIAYINAGDFIKVSDIDGVHYAAEMHGKLANAVASILSAL